MESIGRRLKKELNGYSLGINTYVWPFLNSTPASNPQPQAFYSVPVTIYFDVICSISTFLHILFLLPENTPKWISTAS